MTYETLLAETLPARIETEEECDRIHSRYGELLNAKRRTAAEERLMNLLGLLLEEYDRRHALPPDDSTPAELLQFLLDHSGKKPADLIPVFRTRGHVSEALRGKRPISASQARVGPNFPLESRTIPVGRFCDIADGVRFRRAGVCHALAASFAAVK